MIMRTARYVTALVVLTVAHGDDVAAQRRGKLPPHPIKIEAHAVFRGTAGHPVFLVFACLRLFGWRGQDRYLPAIRTVHQALHYPAHFIELLLDLGHALQLNAQLVIDFSDMAVHGFERID